MATPSSPKSLPVGPSLATALMVVSCRLRDPALLCRIHPGQFYSPVLVSRARACEGMSSSVTVHTNIYATL